MSGTSRASIAMVLLLLAGCAPRPSGQMTDSDRDALRRLTDAQVKALLAANWNQFVATFSDDVVRMPPDQPVVQGREVVRAWQKTFPPVASLQNWIDSIDGDGTVAYMRGHNAISLLVAGKPTRLSFKWLGVYRKQSDGTWLMVADMWNANPRSDADSSGT